MQILGCTKVAVDTAPLLTEKAGLSGTDACQASPVCRMKASMSTREQEDLKRLSHQVLCNVLPYTSTVFTFASFCHSASFSNILELVLVPLSELLYLGPI